MVPNGSSGHHTVVDCTSGREIFSPCHPKAPLDWCLVIGYECNKLSVMFVKHLWNDSSSAHQGSSHQQSTRRSQRDAQVLGASWEVLPEGSPVEASGPTYCELFLEIFEAGPLCLRENPRLKSTSNACSGLTHFVQTHVRLTFSFWSRCPGESWCYIVLHIHFYEAKSFISLFPAWKMSKDWTGCVNWNQRSSEGISASHLGLLIFIDCGLFSWCPPTPPGRELLTDSIIFAAASKRNDRKINTSLWGLEGGCSAEAIMFFWQVYNKSLSSQYFHNRILWSAALWCLNVGRTGFSVPHLSLFIVCKCSTRRSFPLLKHYCCTSNTHFWPLGWQIPPPCANSSLTLCTPHSLCKSVWTFVCKGSWWVSLLFGELIPKNLRPWQQQTR